MVMTAIGDECYDIDIAHRHVCTHTAQAHLAIGITITRDECHDIGIAH